jgi:hypothetical protein
MSINVVALGSMRVRLCAKKRFRDIAVPATVVGIIVFSLLDVDDNRVEVEIARSLFQVYNSFPIVARRLAKVLARN